MDGILFTPIIKSSGIKRAILVGNRYTLSNTREPREVHSFQIWLESMLGKDW